MSLPQHAELRGHLSSMVASKSHARASIDPADAVSEGARPRGRISASKVPLPDPHGLLQAVCGQPEGDEALTKWARDLADLHAELLRHRLRPMSRRSEADDDEARAEIDRIVGEVDAWAIENLSRVNCARMHTHSLGEIISHIAMSSADAWWIVLHSRDASTRHRAWSQLAQALEGYTEMLTEISAQRLRLPEGGSRIGRVIT